MISGAPPAAEATAKNVRNLEALPGLRQCGRQLSSTSYAVALNNEGCCSNGVDRIRPTGHRCAR